MQVRTRFTLTIKNQDLGTKNQISSSFSSMLGMPSVTGNFLDVSGQTRSPLITSIWSKTQSLFFRIYFDLAYLQQSMMCFPQEVQVSLIVFRCHLQGCVNGEWWSLIWCLGQPWASPPGVQVAQRPGKDNPSQSWESPLQWSPGWTPPRSPFEKCFGNALNWEQENLDISGLDGEGVASGDRLHALRGQHVVRQQLHGPSLWNWKTLEICRRI